MFDCITRKCIIVKILVETSNEIWSAIYEAKDPLSQYKARRKWGRVVHKTNMQAL